MSDAKHDAHGKKDAGHGHGDDGHKKKKHGGHGGGHGGGGHGGEEHEGAPEWLISFADMVMLMMGFFVILFAMNVQPKGGNAGGGGEQSEGVANEPDIVDFAIAVRRAFHNDVDLSSTDPKDQLLIQRILSERYKGSGESKDEGTKGADQNVQSVRPADHYGQGTSVVFASKSATLSDDAAKALDELARRYKGQSTVIEVRGHVGVAENYGSPEAGMTLSIDRALAAAKRLAAGGIDWWRIRVEAAGSGERVEAAPMNAASDARNARVEVRVLDEIAAPRGPVRPVASATEGSGRAE
jgi:outer membrane protein OmpA-like peptidoglycan-associated protein